MSELTQQLATFRKEHVSSKPVSVGRASLFLSATDAAGIDFHEVHEACMNGIATLAQYEPRFNTWNGTLLHPSSINTQRELLTKEENKTLNKQIHALLRLIGLFASEPAAHKVLEYLLQRYRINELNTDVLLSSMLLMHDTKIFARLVQLCPPQDQTIWNFLDHVRKTGNSINRTQIIKHLLKGNVSLLANLAAAVASAVKLASKEGLPELCATVTGCDLVISFQTALILEWLDACKPLAETQLRALLPQIFDGIHAYEKALASIEEANGSIGNSSSSSGNTSFAGFEAKVHVCQQWRRSSIMLVAQLMRSRTGSQLGRPVMKSLLQALSNAFVCISRQAIRCTDKRLAGSLQSDALEIVMTIAILVQQMQAISGNKIAKMEASVLSTLFIGTGTLSRLRADHTQLHGVGSPVVGSSVAELGGGGGGTGGSDADDQYDSTGRALRRGSILPSLPAEEQAELEEDEIEMYTARNMPPFLQALQALQDAFPEGAADLVTSVSISLMHLMLTATFASEQDTPVLPVSGLSANKLGNTLVALASSERTAVSTIRTLVDLILRAASLHGSPENRHGSKSRKAKGKSVVTQEQRAATKLFALVRILVQRHPLIFDPAVDIALQSATGEAQENIRAFLGNVFIDTPYRAPIAGGTSLLLSLQHPSHTIRVQALDTFAKQVPLRNLDAEDSESEPDLSDCDKDDAISRAARVGAKAVKAAAAAAAEAAGVIPRKHEEEFVVPHANRRVLPKGPVQEDLLGIVDAAARLLVDADVEVALSVWSPKVVERIVSYSDPVVIANITVQAVDFWMQQHSVDPAGGSNAGVQAATVITAILDCLAEDSIMKAIAQSGATVAHPLGISHSISIADWLFVVITGFTAGVLNEVPVSPAQKGSSAKTAKDAIETWAGVRSAALQTAYSCAPYIPLLSHLSGKRSSMMRSTKRNNADKEEEEDDIGLLVPLLVQAVCTSEDDISMAALTKGLQATESLRSLGHCCSLALSTAFTANDFANANDLFARKHGHRFAAAFMRVLYAMITELFDKETGSDTSASSGSSPTKDKNTRRKSMSREGVIAAANALYSSLPVLCPLLLAAAEVPSLCTEASTLLETVLSRASAQRLYDDSYSVSPSQHGPVPSLNTASVENWVQCKAFADAAVGSGIFFPTQSIGSKSSDSKQRAGFYRNVIEDTTSVSSESTEERREAQASADKQNLGTRLLCMLLQAPQQQLASLLGVCLKAFFPVNPAMALVHACLSPSGQVVSTHCRAGALIALAACVTSDVTLPTSFALVVQFIAVTSVCDANILVRSAGIALLDKLAKLKNLHATCPPDSTLMLTTPDNRHTALERGKSPAAADIAALAMELLTVSASLEMDGDASRALISSKIMSANAAVAQQLLYVASIAGVHGGTRGAELATIIIRAAAATSLDHTWRYLHYTTAQICMGNFARSDEIYSDSSNGYMHAISVLLEAVLQCTDLASQASAEVQNKVCSWAHSLLLSTNTFIDEDSTPVESSGVAMQFMRRALITRIGKGWALFTESHPQGLLLRQNMFTALMLEQSAHPGQEIVLHALQALPLPLITIQPVLTAATSAFDASYDLDKAKAHSLEDAEDANSMQVVPSIPDFDVNENKLSATGLAQPMQQLTCALEALQYPLTASAGAIGNNAEQDTSAMGSILLHLLQSLARVCDPRLNAILSVEYTKCLLMDMSKSCITTVPEQHLQHLLSTGTGTGTGAATAAGGKSKKSASGSASAVQGNGYPVSRLQMDIDTVLTCITSAASGQVHGAALRLLKALLILDTDGKAATQCVYNLGQLLASAAAGSALAREGSTSGGGILAELLEALVYFASKAGGNASHPQLILQPLCLCLPQVQPQRRNALLHMAVKALGPATALPPAIAVLMSHVFAAHEIGAEKQEKTSVSSVTTLASIVANGQENGFILLSRAASKKAARLVSASIPEDLFRAAIETTAAQSADVQVKTLVATANAAQGFLAMLTENVASGTSSAASGDINVELLHSYRAELSRKARGAALSSVPPKKGKIASAALSLNPSLDSNGETPAQSRGAAAAMVLLHLEYLYDIVENRAFHRQLVTMLDSPTETRETAHSRTQTMFLDLFDQLLQLITSAAALNGPNAGTDKEGTLDMCLGSQDLPIALSAFARTVDTWCLDILRSLHRLLDAASVVSILQELLEHEHANVRKAALQILSQRLERLSNNGQGPKGGASGEEALLMLDLATQLRRNTEEILGYNEQTQTLALTAMSPMEASSRAELAQSSLMCLDALARALGGDRAWSAPLMAALKTCVMIASQIMQSFSISTVASIEANGAASGANKTTKAVKAGRGRSSSVASTDSTSMATTSASTGASVAAAQGSMLTLLASLFLCSGTIMKASSVGARALPFLSPLVTCILNAVTAQPAAAEEEQQLYQQQHGTPLALISEAASTVNGMARARTLLLRSALTSITNIVSAVPAFYHPHIQQTLSVCLGLDIPLPGASYRGVNTAKSALVSQMSSGEISAMSADIDQCISSIALQVPTRLAVPALALAVPDLLSRGHGTALRTARFLGETYCNLDREAILAHMPDIYEVSCNLLSYRHIYSNMANAANDAAVISADEMNASIAVEECSCEAIVNLCLKLTEVELRSFLARLAEWRDTKLDTDKEAKRANAIKNKRSRGNNGKNQADASDSGSDSDEDENDSGKSDGMPLVSRAQYARRTAFYRLLGSLGNKLQSLFTPCLIPFWQHGADTLLSMETHKSKLSALMKLSMSGGNSDGSADSDSDADSDSNSDSDAVMQSKKRGGNKANKAKLALQAAKNKKRKLAALKNSKSKATGTGNNDTKSSLSVTRYAEANELVTSCSAVLDAVRIACTHDTTQTIDEERYSTMMPAVVNLLVQVLPYFTFVATAPGSGDDGKLASEQASGAYRQMISDHVTPCLSALASCVGRDTLWKPLVHKILMASRDKSSAIRLAAVQTLHKLFIDLGEELLILLPECLPFLSELLEDDASDVVDAASMAIRYIEDLSGEKLDEYLK